MEVLPMYAKFYCFIVMCFVVFCFSGCDNITESTESSDALCPGRYVVNPVEVSEGVVYFAGEDFEGLQTLIMRGGMLYVFWGTPCDSKAQPTKEKPKTVEIYQGDTEKVLLKSFQLQFSTDEGWAYVDLLSELGDSYNDFFGTLSASSGFNINFKSSFVPTNAKFDLCIVPQQVHSCD